MQFQKVHVSIVRSIRHVSLVRDWHRARGTRDLPEFSDFVPNERAGDAADLSISDIVARTASFICPAPARRAGARRMPARPLSDCLIRMAVPRSRSGTPRRQQIAGLFDHPVSDRDGCGDIDRSSCPTPGGGAEVMVAAYACSTEGRFAHQIAAQPRQGPLHWAVIVDPAIAAAPRPASDADIEIGDGVLDDEVSSATR